ncbi:hypothetical protein CC86DRAFT_466228 [Ophiobolus disseminans]|uniref:Uncharacterized protein n=1 Tax=Ophiobolus disseminans TaxID=1469910 RepID=A0A6A7A4F1_9PLEO|nr:hypothetical protein CC86DRAFT_466228 [Ophiobolus disseminans]
MSLVPVAHDAMDVYIAWLYSSGKAALQPIDREGANDDSEDVTDADKFEIFLLRCYHLACVFQDPNFMTDVIDTFFDHCIVEGLSGNVVCYAYDQYTFQMKRLVIMHTLSWAERSSNGLRDLLEDTPNAFAIDLDLERVSCGWAYLKRTEVMHELIGEIGGWWKKD